MNRAKIREICPDMHSGGTPSTKNPSYWGGDLPWLSSSESGQRFVNNAQTFITQIGAKNSSTKLAKRGSTIVATAGDGKTRGQVSFLNIDAYINQSLIAMYPKKELMLPHYLYYYLSNSYDRLRNLSNATGVRGSLSGGLLGNMVVDFPDLETQEKTVDLLLAIDSKIINNNTINAELEAMAKAIYDYWFLQFEFPDENGKPYKSSGGKMVYNEELKREIPEGWEVKSIFDASDVVYGYPLSTECFAEKDGIPVVRIRDILDNSVSAHTTERVEHKYLTATKDLLIGMDGNFHMNFWSREGDCVNQRIVRVRSNGEASTLQIYFEIYPFIKQREQNVARSTVGHLSDKDMKQLRILVSNNDNTNKTFDDILSKICFNKKENQELASLRDFLLPLLMNGQVGFKD